MIQSRNYGNCFLRNCPLSIYIKLYLANIFCETTSSLIFSEKYRTASYYLSKYVNDIFSLDTFICKCHHAESNLTLGDSCFRYPGVQCVIRFIGLGDFLWGFWNLDVEIIPQGSKVLRKIVRGWQWLP